MTIFASGITPPATAVVEGITPPATVVAACGAAPSSAWARCGTGNEPPVLDPIAVSPELGVPTFLVLTGLNFDGSAAVAIAGTGITIVSTIVVDAQTILLQLTIGDGATGVHATTVTTGNGTSNPQNLTVVESTPPVPEVNPGDLRLWVEADFGVRNASDAAAVAGDAVATWRDRSGWNHHLTPATAYGYTAPVFRDTGFGGVAALPYLEFDDIHGLKTALAAGLDVSSFAMMVVWYREAADSNSAFFYMVSDIIGLGVQDSAASSYFARWNSALKTALRESSFQQVGGWVPKSLRQLVRVMWDGLTHAGHKTYLNGVQQALPTQLNSIAAPMVSTGPSEVRLGFRDSSLPQFNIQGRLAACVLISPKPPDADVAAWETYLNRWRGGSAPAPTVGHGPVTVTATIDGVNVTVVTFGDRTTITFDQAIRKFAMTLPNAPAAPNVRVAFGCSGVSPAGTILGGVTGMGWTSTEGGVRKSMQYDAGFTTVVIESAISNVFGGSGFDDARFWLVGEPL